MFNQKIYARYSVLKHYGMFSYLCIPLILSQQVASVHTNFMESQVLQDTVKPFRVSIEGNIGAGKSEMIKHFSGFTDVDAHMVSLYTKYQKH